MLAADALNSARSGATNSTESTDWSDWSDGELGIVFTESECWLASGIIDCEQARFEEQSCRYIQQSTVDRIRRDKIQ